MKNVKRAILGIGILSAGLLSAQSAEMTNMLKIGGNVGIAAPSTNASAKFRFRCCLSTFGNSTDSD